MIDAAVRRLLWAPVGCGTVPETTGSIDWERKAGQRDAISAGPGKTTD